MESEKLIINYHNSQTKIKEINSLELQQIKNYLNKIFKNELSLSDLEQSINNSSNSPKSNKGLYISLAAVGVLLAGIVAWLILRNKKNKN